MNDQWSGKILRAKNLTKPPPVTRWSSQSPPIAPSFMARPWAGAWFRESGVAVVTRSLVLVDVPEAGTDRLGEVCGGHEVALVVDRDRQLRQRALGRSEDDPGAVGHVEGRLVAGAEHGVGLRRRQGQGAASCRERV